MYAIQQSHDNSDWRYVPNSQFMKCNELPKVQANNTAKWLRGNNHTGAFYRVVETITAAEVQGFVKWLMDDSDDLETIASGDDLKILELINSEAKDYFGQTITLEQFIMVKEGLPQGAKG